MSAWDELQRLGTHPVFLEMIYLAKLKPTLDGEHTVTVFAPDDAVWDDISTEQMAHFRSEEGLGDLRRQLGAHIVWGEHLPEQVTGIKMVSTLAGTTLLLKPHDDGHHHHEHSHGHADGSGESCDVLLSVEDAGAVSLALHASTGPVMGVDRLFEPGDIEDQQSLKDAPDCDGEGGSGHDRAGHHGGSGHGANGHRGGRDSDSPRRSRDNRGSDGGRGADESPGGGRDTGGNTPGGGGPTPDYNPFKPKPAEPPPPGCGCGGG